MDEYKVIIDAFHSYECNDSCPFKERCDKLYNKTKNVLPAPFTLCNVILGTYIL